MTLMPTVKLLNQDSSQIERVVAFSCKHLKSTLEDCKLINVISLNLLKN